MAQLKIGLAKDPFQPQLIKNAQGEDTIDSEEALYVLTGKHFPGINCGTHRTTSPKPQRRYPRPKDWALAKRLFTKERVSWTIRTFRPFRSPGIDQIIPALIIESREFQPIFQPFLTYPPLGRKREFISIHKPGKVSYAEAEAHSLTLILLMERVVDRYASDEKAAHVRQHAYMAGRSV